MPNLTDLVIAKQYLRDSTSQEDYTNRYKEILAANNNIAVSYIAALSVGGYLAILAERELSQIAVQEIIYNNLGFQLDVVKFLVETIHLLEYFPELAFGIAQGVFEILGSFGE